MLDMATDGEDGFPTCTLLGEHVQLQRNMRHTGDWVGTHNGMNSLEFRTNILRRSSLLIVQFKAAFLSNFIETWLRKSRIESVQKLLIGRA